MKRMGFVTERNCRRSPESLMQGSSTQKVPNISNNPIKKRTHNHLRVKRVRPYKGRAHSKVSIIADSLPSNSEEQSELFLPSRKLPPDLLRPNPKPPNQDNESRNNLGDVAIDWGTEERNLAPKLYKSQNPSTSTVLTRFHYEDSDNIKKREVQGISKCQKYGASCDSLRYVRTASCQIPKGEKTDKVHWEPPCERSTHHE